MFAHVSKDVGPMAPGARTRGRYRRSSCLILAGAAALAACGEVVPIVPDALSDDVATLASLDLGAFGALAPAFDPEVTTYRVSYSLLVQELAVTATPVHPDATVTVNGEDVVPGQPSDSIALLAGGETAVNVEVRAPSGSSRTYVITADQGGAIEQRLYGKASNPTGALDPGGQDQSPFNDVGDEFAFAIAADGDTVVVGAHLEDSSSAGIGGAQDNDNAPDSGAVYVYRRQDGAWAQEAYIKASNNDPFDEFGRALAIEDNVLVVGAPYEDSNGVGVNGDQISDGLDAAGAVYVFRRVGNAWQQEAYIKPRDPKALALFGWHVALDDEVLVVGAPGIFSVFPGDPINDASPNQGAAYVFRYNGTTWVEETVLQASNGEPLDQFGAQVGVDDDYVAVSAVGESSGVGGDLRDPLDNSKPMSGAVYVFEYQEDATWKETAYLKSGAPDGPLTPPVFPDCFQFFECEGDRFGARIGLDDETLVVGAYLEDSAANQIGGDSLDNAARNAGGAWVFRRNGEGNWAQEAYLKPSNAEADDLFAQYLGIANDLVAIAANGESSGAQSVGGDPDNNNSPSAGAVYLFRRQGTTWQQIEYIKAANAESPDNFGVDTVLTDSMLVIGAVWESGGSPGLDGNPDDNNGPRSGAFYVFQ
jgi:hypothetical protein